MIPPDVAPRPAPRAVLWALAATLLAVAASFLARRRGLDTQLFLAVNGWRGLPDALWATLSVAGLGLTALVAFAAGARRLPRAFATLPWMLLVGGGLTHLVKQAIPMARPASVLGTANLHVVGPMLEQRSMPSGHAMTATAAACILFLAGGPFWRRPWVVVASFALAAAIALSRIASGAHWPADVLAGVALGWATGYVSVLLANVTRTETWLATAPGGWLLGATQLGAAVAIAMDQGYGRTLPIQWALAAVSVFAGVRTLSRQPQWARLRRRAQEQEQEEEAGT